MCENKPNYKKLAISILLDLIGMLSFVIPFVGEFGDVVWAPLSGWIMTRMYKGTTGKIAGAVTFIEEILPGVDIIPSFTLMWIYASFIEKDKMLDK